jgi:hypothetical protein
MTSLAQAARHVLWFNMARKGEEPSADVLEILQECAGAIRRDDRPALQQLEDEQPLYLALSILVPMPTGLQDLEKVAMLDQEPEQAAAAPGGISLMQ